MSANYEYVGYSGTGNFTQSGGTNTLASYLRLGYNTTASGTYTLTDTAQSTSLFSVEEDVGYSGTGTFNQSGGTNQTTWLDLGDNAGSSGSYTLSGTGWLFTTEEDIGTTGAGTFTQNGGFNSLIDYVILAASGSGNGTYNLNAGWLYSAEIYVGYYGPGNFIQTGGTNTGAYSIQLGQNPGSSGTYTLSNTGYITTVTNETVGEGGTGTFIQTGGTNNVYQLYVGGSPNGIWSSGRGTYTLSSTGLLSARYEDIGYSGAGTFTQTGGTNTGPSWAPLVLILAVEPGSSGTYNLNGGLLSVASLSSGSGTAVFNFNGGMLNIAATFASNLPIALNTSSFNATFDTGGYNVTLSGPLSGPGGLVKADSGTLTLAGSNTYSGGTTLSAGQLDLNNASALGTGTFTISGGTIGNTSGAAITLSTNNAQFWNGDFTFAGTNDLNLGAGNVTMSSSRTVTVASNNLTVGGVISDSGSGYSLTKAGTGTLTLAGSNTYSGGTTVAAGVLAVNGSLGASGNVYVQATASLAGTGSVGNVTVSSSGTVAPGSGGTLTAASLSLATGDILAYTLGTGTGNDSLLAVSGGLTLSSSVTLNVTPGAAWGNGSYVLATFGSLIDSSSNFSGWTVTGTGLRKHTYTFAISGGSLDLTVVPVPPMSWIAPGGGSWATSANWAGGAIPTTQDDTASFGTSIGSSTATVTLDGARTLGGLVFSTTGGGTYIIASNDGSALTLANYGSPVPVTVSGGNHTISAPMTLNDNLNFSANPGAGLTLSGSVSGAGAVTVGGSGTLTITGTTNTYTGGTTVNSGTLSLGPGGYGLSTVGSGAVTVNAGGTLVGKESSLGEGYGVLACSLIVNGGVVTANATGA